jgi:hypothetical protein
MYGTLSFGKGDKSASAEFHAFSAVHGKGRRQPACDACRTARVKCLGSPDGDKCSRCRGRYTPCTYSSTRRQHRHSEVSSETSESDSSAKRGNKDASLDEAREQKPLTPPKAESTPTPQRSPHPLQTVDEQWWDSHTHHRFEPFDFTMDPGADAGTTGPQNVAPSQQEIDTAASTCPAGSSTTLVDHNFPPQYDFSALSHEFTPQEPLLMPFLTSMSSTSAWDGACGQSEGHNPSSPPPHTQVDLQHPGDGPVDSPSASLSQLDFSDLVDVMQFSKGGHSGSATPVSDSCTCLQGLTASLFSLRCRSETMQIDEFLVLFKQAMQKCEAVEVCPSACCNCRSFALLLLMTVQELVTLMLEVTATVKISSAPSGKRNSVPAINLGAFSVDDETDQGIISRIILAARMKELHSFISRMSCQMKLAGLDDICTKFNHHMKAVRTALST